VIQQRYVSDELTHFVGRSLPNDDARCDLLIQILTNGWLLADPRNQNQLYPFPTEDAFVLNMIESISEDIYQPTYQPHAVCFCDIPLDDLGIHMQKYGHFGLSFPKRVLIEKGASLVFYVAKNASVISTLHDNRESYFKEEVERYRQGGYFKNRDQIHELLQNNMGDEASHRFRLDESHLRTFFGYYIFGFIKLFDDAAPAEASRNFYMEREWRALGNVRFELDDMRRVILPKRYIGRFRRALPDYTGEITPAP
jgi:hypothetical protein